MLFLLALPVLVGNQACAACHADIAAEYSKTPMAQTSGHITQVPSGTFRHAASGTQYQVESSGAVRLSRGATIGERVLQYFIGSGAEGRSYLWQREGFLFEAPLTWYARTKAWAASPGYEADRQSRWNRAVEPSCLFCHSSGAKWREGTENRYDDPPFAENGVACERCHGPGSLHVQGKAKMVNPAKLAPSQRDSVCAQCHLSGESRIVRAGKRLDEFRPGEVISDFAAYFVRDEPAPLNVNSHVEKLALSMCKRASGDKLWCGSCHDPHEVPAPAERAAYFRGKCLSCHQTSQCDRGFDCASCHMPKSTAADAHGVFTDHSIPRVPRKGSTVSSWRLRGFFNAKTADRDLGLAYAEVAARTRDARQRAEAIRLLSAALPDPDAQTQLAFLLEATDPKRAVTLYEASLRQKPGQALALVNLGRLLGSAGDLDRAIALWRDALGRNPCLEQAGSNLQIALRAKGDASGADAVRESQRSCVF
ncbi:MAG TPA: multiheme c-type cytochrome [Bryobacteraceae bacterium]|nr:multiheme c-type cytochrome [Bryobacteraceae bacterium]